MDIYDYLKMDHDFVSHLFKLFENSKLTERRKQIVDQIIEELLTHAHSEEETFYKALINTEAIEEIKHSEKEHKEIEKQIKLLLGSKQFNENWINKVNKLKEIVEHHVSEEENNVFDEAKKVLSKDEAYRLKEQMHYLKMDLQLSQNKKKVKKTAKK